MLVVSTTGDGEVPNTALKFWKKLRKIPRTGPRLQHLRYSILGLGDTNYTNFCNGGKLFDQQFTELGAQAFYPCAWADDAVGLELTVEPWIEGLWPALKNEHIFECLKTTEKSNTMDTTDVDSTLPSEGPISEHDAKSEDPVPNPESDGPRLPNPLLNNSITDIPLGVELMKQAPHSNYIMDLAAKPLDNMSKVEILVQPELENGFSYTDSGLCTSHLEDTALTIPILSPPYLVMSLKPEEKVDLNVCSLQNDAPFPSMGCPIQRATVLSSCLLTSPGAVKTTLDLELYFEDPSAICYQPGDAISVICPNDEREVDLLIHRLGLVENADIPFELSIMSTTTKKKASCPNYIPSKCTIRHALTHCLDIREPPKKALLRMLVEYASSEKEKYRLQELCSKQGMAEYTKYIREPQISLLDLLLSFPSITSLPFERLIELLPRLLPRPYSVACSQEINKNKLHIVFNVIEIPAGQGRRYRRQGVCSGWLEHITRPIRTTMNSEKSFEEDLNALSLTEKPQVSIFTRTVGHFHLPANCNTPIIMIGPGTGVAPFIGYLQHRSWLQDQMEDKLNSLGEAWLFYGCRHQKKDFLFKDDVNTFLEKGSLTKFLVSFSRDEQPEGSPRYVQDNMHTHSKELIDLIDKGAVIFVCGDAKNMAKDVNSTFVAILAQEKELTEEAATTFLMELRKEKRYLEDIWT